MDDINEEKRLCFGGALLPALILEKLTFFKKVDFFEKISFL